MLSEFVSALVLSLLLCLVLAKLAPSIGLMDVPGKPRKTHLHSVPLVGGLAIWLAVTLAASMTQAPFFWKWWWGVSLMGLVGLLDDWFKFSVWIKLGLQLLAALTISYVLWENLLAVSSFESRAIFLFTTGWLVLMTNAVNYMDNTNGLCGGMVLITLVGTSVTLIDNPLHPVNEDLALFVGGIIGFLILNFPSGRIFLGDSGSHFLGALLAVSIILSGVAGTFDNAKMGYTKIIFTMLFLAGIPLLDFIQVTIGRWRRGQLIWQGDQNHLSHLLMRRGFTPVQAVLILWGVTGVSVVAAFIVDRYTW